MLLATTLLRKSKLLALLLYYFNLLLFSFPQPADAHNQPRDVYLLVMSGDFTTHTHSTFVKITVFLMNKRDIIMIECTNIHIFRYIVDEIERCGLKL